MGVRVAICIAVFLAGWDLSSAAGEEVGLAFNGELAYSFAVYGQTVPVDSEAIARLVYETTTAADYNLGGCDCATYRQRIYNGFSVQFGELALRSDEYDIHVINDFAPGGGSDFVRIVFSSNQIPAFETPLAVNDVPQAAGQLVISLRDPTGAALTSSALPAPAAFGGFYFYEAFLRDSPSEPAYDVAANLNAPAPFAPVVGDFDFDDDADGADFLVWQRGVGTAVPSPADADRNAVVDSGDLTVWVDHWGEGVSSSRASATIAEPSSIALAGTLAAAGISLVRARRRLQPRG